MKDSMKENLPEHLGSPPADYFSHHRTEMMDFILHHPRKILDVGCGEATFSRQLKEKFNAEVWGVELDPQACATAEKRIDKVFHGDIVQILPQLPDSYFDCVVFNDVLEHLADPFRVLWDLKRKLTAEGTVVCSIPNVRHYYVLRDLLVKKQWQYRNSGILDRAHLRFFTRESILDMFDELGYEMIRIQGIHPTKSRNFKVWNFLLLGFLSDARYYQFACVARPKKSLGFE